MARVPYLTRDDLTQEYQAAYDRIANTRGVVGRAEYTFVGRWVLQGRGDIHHGSFRFGERD